MRRHLILFDPKGSPVTWQRRLWAKVHNATLLVIYVDDMMVARGWKPPRRYRRAHILRYLDAWVYAVPPLHWILRAWFHIGGIWAAPRLADRLGFLQLDEGRLYTTAKPRWPWCTRWYADYMEQRGYEKGKLEQDPISFRRGYNDGWFKGRVQLTRDIMRRSELAKSDDIEELKREISARRGAMDKGKEEP